MFLSLPARILVFPLRRTVSRAGHGFSCLRAMSNHASNKTPLKLAVVQLTSKENKDDNFEVARKLVETASRDGARMAFLPECFDMVCPSKQMTMENGEPMDGPIINRYRQLASQLRIWLSLGGFHEKDASSNDPRLFNAHIIIDDSGEIVSIYRKVHLFNLDIPGTRLVESEFSQPGSAVLKPIVTPVGRVAQGICYDLRFAEFAISLAKGGADILTYPSSFTVPTGKAHWETLLKARAIETQCYVVAAGQSGQHNAKRSSYGHSMVIDPWGKTLAHIEAEGPGVAYAEIDFDHLADVRSRLPVFTDRRPELYGNIIPAVGVSCAKQEFASFQFGEKAVVEPEQVFVVTQHSIGFVNHRPVLPGHVLVAPLRAKATHFADLSQAEVFDLFQLVQRVQKAIETVHGAQSSTIAIQDGIDAGQSIEHLHVHLLPRKPTDFGGNIDEIYERLQQHDKGPEQKSGKRTREQMALETAVLRKHFL